MTATISYFILFGILSIIKGKPSIDSAPGQSELQRLLQDLSKQQGKYDIALSHHEDGPKTHHEDRARISLHEDRYSTRGHDHHHHASYEGQDSFDNHPSLTNIQSLNLFYKKKPSTMSKNNDIDNILDNLRSQKCSSIKNCKTRDWKSRSQGRIKDYSRTEYDNIDEVLEFLNDLDTNLEDGYNGGRNNVRCRGNCGRARDDRNDYDRDEGDNLRCLGDKCAINGNDSTDSEVIIPVNGGKNLRCIGNRCARNRDDRNDDDRDDRNNLRCTGNRCARNRDDRNDDDRDDRNNLRCTGNRCARNRDDRNNDDRDDRNNLRCTENRCARNRDDRNDDDDDRADGNYIRCIGDRCSRNRNDDDRDDRNNLRCAGDRCARNRDNDADRDDREDLACNDDRCGRNRDDNDRDDGELLRCANNKCGLNRDDNDRPDLRCDGDVCGLNRNDRDDAEYRCAGDRCGRNRDDADRNERDNLRCRGKRCARTRNDDDDEDYNNLYGSQRKPKQYKLSNDLKAVVLDISDLDHLLSNLNVRKNQLRGAKLLENVDLENLLSYTNGNDKKANVEAVVFDLDKEKDRNTLSKQIKRLLSQGNSSSK